MHLAGDHGDRAPSDSGYRPGGGEGGRRRFREAPPRSVHARGGCSRRSPRRWRAALRGSCTRWPGTGEGAAPAQPGGFCSALGCSQDVASMAKIARRCSVTRRPLARQWAMKAASSAVARVWSTARTLRARLMSHLLWRRRKASPAPRPDRRRPGRPGLGPDLPQHLGEATAVRFLARRTSVPQGTPVVPPRHLLQPLGIMQGRSDRGSSPWSTLPRSPGRTSPVRPSFHRPPPMPGAASSNRR